MDKNLVFFDFPDQIEKRIPQSSVDQEGYRKDNFFNSKKKRWMIVWSIVFVVVIFIAIRFLLDFSFASFIASVIKARKVSHFLLISIFGFFTFFVCEVFLRVRALKEKLGDRLREVTKFEWLSFSVISFVVQSITPFSIGSEPYSIWWLTKKKIPVREASAVVAVNSVCWFIGQFLITWPSFIYITSQNMKDISTLQVTKVYWFVLAGLIVDILVSLFIFFISYSKIAHYWISKFNNYIRKIFGLSYSTNDELLIRYLNKSQFQKIYLSYLLNTSTFRVIGWYLFNNVWVYGLFVFIYRCFNYEFWSSSTSPAIQTYNIINVATTATNFFPLPSSEGSLQVIIKELLAGILKDQKGGSDYGSTIMLWRFFCKYFGLIFSFFFILLFGINTQKRILFKGWRKNDQTPPLLVF